MAPHRGNWVFYLFHQQWSIELFFRTRNRFRWCFVILGFLCTTLSSVQANVAYPGIWTALQPDGSTTGTEQILVGTAEYHFAVVETDTSFYPTLRGSDGWINYATKGLDGRYLASNQRVGNSNPDDNPYLQRAIHENRHVVHAKCMEQDFCRWRLQQQLLSHSEEPLVTSGSVLNLVIPFQFSDHALSGRSVTSTHDLDQYLFNGETLSVQDYFQQQSYGKLQIVSEIAPWVNISYTEAQCASQESGLTLSMHTCLEDALDEASLQFADWTTLIQSAAFLTFVHSGYAAEYGGNDVDGRWYEERIWSHAWEMGTSNHYNGRYALISDKYDRKNAHMNRVGVAVHEIAQVLGAPNMYGDYPGYGLGYYEMLSNPWGFDGTLTHCGSMSPYVKNLFGWVEVIEIDTDGSYELTQSYESNVVYKIQRGFPDGEYLLLENRQEEGYDKGLSQPGLAIFHIDVLASNVGGTIEDGTFPADHYIVALVQGDGRFDLERMEDEGDSGDLFHAGRFTGVGPNGVTVREGTTATNGYSNTNSYQSGEELPTGISISGISAANKVMSFEVTFT